MTETLGLSTRHVSLMHLIPAHEQVVFVAGNKPPSITDFYRHCVQSVMYIAAIIYTILSS